MHLLSQHREIVFCGLYMDFFSLVPVSLFVVILIVTRTCVISLVVTPFSPLNLQILNRILVELMCGGLKIRVCLSLLGSIPIFLLLDTFLTSRTLHEHIQSCEISPCTFCDHEFVSLVVDLSSFVQHGPGIWKFNNSLLSNEIVCQKIRSAIDICPSVVDFWESLKQDLRQIQLNFLILSPMIARMIECY